ncbi:MAG: glycosyltransferase, partial [Chromatiaceae bacterium]|nr:glycosyltransferase [Chromatiaceae bacterium]
LQAMACGLPVISTTVGAEGIEADDGFNILIADSADGFLKQIEELTTDSCRYASVRREALATISRVYSWGRQLAPLRELVGLEPGARA